MQLPQPLVSPQWLHSHYNDKNLLIFDSSMEKSVSGGSVAEKAYLPNAQHFDFSTIFCDQSATTAHMMPHQADFTREIRRMGVNDDSVIVVYDVVGIYSSPRVWWMLKCMGLDKVYILDGGLPAWREAGFKLVESLEAAPGGGQFTACLEKDWLASAEKVLGCISLPDTRIIDAREHLRFEGRIEEPRPGLRPGHIPSSLNIPFKSVLNQNQYADIDTIRQIFGSLELHNNQKLIFSCGSGVTACIVMVAAYMLGYRHLSIYDGSWSEWGSQKHFPIHSSFQLSINK